MGYWIFFLLLSLQVFAVPGETLERLQKLYPDQNRNFLIQRLNSASTTFDRLRDFPPYFYEASERVLKLPMRKGLCAGDPHYENFGFLYADVPFFSINDLDDSAPCNLNADALRLLVGHRLIFRDLDIARWVNEYEAGLARVRKSIPSDLIEMKAASERNGNDLSSKFQKSWDSRSCLPDLVPATENEIRFLKSQNGNGTLVFACSRTKTTGGSAGLKRIIGFYLAPELQVIEYKPLVTPAPFYAGNLTQAERARYFADAVEYFFVGLPGNFSITYNSKLYLRRKLIAGNVPVELKDGKKKEIAYYEAYTLGRLHRGATSFFSLMDWKNYSDALISVFEQEFAR